MKYAIIENGIVTNVAMAGGPMAENWIETDAAGIGWTYSDGIFTEPLVIPPPVVIDPCEWLLDLGPFYDRFGAAKMPVLTSSDATVRAIIADCNVRKWIDLQNPDVANGLAYIGTVVAALTPAIQTAILTTPVTAEENRVLRKLYF